MWTNNLSDMITIDLMQSERRISCCTSPHYLMPVTWEVCTTSSRTLNWCKTLNCSSYSGCTSRITTSVCLRCSCTAAIQPVLDQLALSGPGIVWWTCYFLHDSLCSFPYIVCVRQILLFLAAQSNPHLRSSSMKFVQQGKLHLHSLLNPLTNQ